MTDDPKPPETAPGWYPHPSMAGTKGYWDGEKWTDAVAPAEQPLERASGPGVLTIARGVALGLAVVIVAIFFIYQTTKESQLDCLTDNVDRAEQGLPTKDCPDD